MHKAAYMAIIFTLGLWTGGIFAPNQTPAQDEMISPQPIPAAAAPHPQQETPDRVQP